MPQPRPTNAIYLSNEPAITRNVPPSQRPTTRIVHQAPAAAQATTRVIRRNDYRGLEPRQQGDRLRARWLTALVGAALPLAAQAIVFRGSLAGLWSSLATDAGAPLALWQQAGVAAGVALAMLAILALACALLARGDGRSFLGGVGAAASLSLVVGLLRVAGMAPSGGGIVAALDEAAAAPFACAMLEDRAQLRRDQATHDDAAKRAEDAEAALAAERASRADEAAAAKAAVADAIARAKAAADQLDAAKRDAAAARDEATTARAEAERAATAAAEAETAKTALAAERDQALAAAAANAQAVVEAKREMARITARSGAVQASVAPSPMPADLAPATTAPRTMQSVAPRSTAPRTANSAR